MRRSSPFFSNTPFSSSLRARPCIPNKRRATNNDSLASSVNSTNSIMPFARKLTPPPPLGSRATMVPPGKPPAITTRSKKERMNCSICLDVIQDQATPDTCSHSFCFHCISAWSHISNDCPLCKTQFLHLRRVDPLGFESVVPVEARRQPVCDGGVPFSSQGWWDFTMCFQCGSPEDENLLLLCDGPQCQRAFHCYCLTPALDCVPEGNWYCPLCVRRGVRDLRSTSSAAALAARDASPRSDSSEDSVQCFASKKRRRTMVAGSSHGSSSGDRQVQRNWFGSEGEGEGSGNGEDAYEFGDFVVPDDQIVYDEEETARRKRKKRRKMDESRGQPPPMPLLPMPTRTHSPIPQLPVPHAHAPQPWSKGCIGEKRKRGSEEEQRGRRVSGYKALVLTRTGSGSPKDKDRHREGHVEDKFSKILSSFDSFAYKKKS